MKTEEIVRRLRERAPVLTAPGYPYKMSVEWRAADALEAQAREIENLEEQFEARLNAGLDELRREVEVLRNVADHARRYALSGHHRGALPLVRQIDRALGEKGSTPEETEGHE